MSQIYVYISYSKKEFKTAKSAVIAICKRYDNMTDYFKEAKKKLCEALGYDDVDVFDYSLLGTDVDIIL